MSTKHSHLSTIAFGPWRLIRAISRGGWTSIFRARPLEALDGPGCYAIKLASASGDDAAIARAMLRREANVAASASHPNLVAVLTADLHGPAPHLLLPFLEGMTSRQLLAAARQPLPVPMSLWIARQMAEALAALHRAGWLHGQVRPQHVIVSPQGHATLIDLSLCRRLESEECAGGQSPPELVAYASPESFLARGRLTAASDAYQLGLLLHELLAGRPPFESADPTLLARMHRSQAPPNVGAVRPDAPQEVAHLLRLMLAKEPLRRPSDDELVRWLTELEIEALS